MQNPAQGIALELVRPHRHRPHHSELLYQLMGAGNC